ncbi:MAG: hypothetical protein H0W90_15860 [Actinobacteria bacterium]|nr:hypothetical protein [Actinomycetota bacterium]
MNEIQLRDRLFDLFPPETTADWEDVLHRAKKPPARRFRRLTLLVAVALLVVLTIGSALALSGRLGGLFHGTPINDLTPRERFQLSEFDMSGKVKLVATRDSTAFYVIRRRDGRLCYSIGRIPSKKPTPFQREVGTRFGGGSCIDSRIFPSKAVPVLDFSFYSLRLGDSEQRLSGLQGFAADPVARVGVIGRDNRIVFSVPVEDNVYSAGRKGIAGARGLVALDKDGKVLWVQCTAGAPGAPGANRSHGCGKYKTSPPPYLPPSKPKPTSPSKPLGPVVVQHGAKDGVSVVVRGTQVTANFAKISPKKRQLLVFKDGRIVLGCFKLVTVGSRLTSSGTYFTKPFTTIVRLRYWSPSGSRPPTAPFDGCTTMGKYGHTWNDAHGTHDAVEIALTSRGRRFLAERATARDIAWLARARVFREIRYGLLSFDSKAASERLGDHTVPLETPNSTPPKGKLGIWIGGSRRIVLAERTTSGRRLYLEIRGGHIYRTNLIGLTQVL